METIFVKQVYTLTAKILGNEITFEPALAKLEGYLAHAKRLNMQRYESETLNTLGILYGINGNIQKQMYYFQAAYQHSDGFADDDFDFTIKITNNLGSAYSGAWQLREAKSILERGITLIDQHNIDVLGSVYIYSNIIGLYINDGDFDKAQSFFDRAWQLAQKVKLKDYSRMEFFIIVTALHHQKAQIDIAKGNCDAVMERLALADEQIAKTSVDDLKQTSDLIRMYHALICEKDEAKATTIEKTLLEQQNGNLATGTALEASLFFQHTNQPEWAKRYAAIVLNSPNDDDDHILTTMRKYAIDILKSVS